MGTKLGVMVMVVALAGVVAGSSAAAAAQEKPAGDAAAFAGTWTGTFDGDSAGKVTLTVVAPKGEAPTGTLKVGPDEGGGYDVAFKTLTLAGTTLKASYEAPDSGGLVTLDGALSGDTIKGTWSAGDASGTWTVTRPSKP